MYTVIEKTQGGAREKVKSYEQAKERALAIKKATGHECNVLSDGIAVWTTETNDNTDAIYFI